MNDRPLNVSTVTHIETTTNGRPNAIVQYGRYKIFGQISASGYFVILIRYNSRPIHKANEKKYNNIAFILQGILSKLFIVNGNIKVISHISKTKQNAIKFFSGMFLVLSLAKKNNKQY